MTRKHRVCFVDELPVGGRRIVEIEGRSIGIFHVNDDFYAVRNRCPHKGAPLCRGMVTGLAVGDVYQFEMEREGEILKCPWHGWEFDLKTGGSVFNPHRMRVKNYEVSVDPAERVVYKFADDPDDEDPSIETFPVSIEHDAAPGRPVLYVHL